MTELESCPFEEPTTDYRIKKMLQKSEIILNAGKKTNFENITESHEKLANFIYLVSYECSLCKKTYGGKERKSCPFKGCLDNELDTLYWLRQEAK